ncbi:DUF2141 domain-containing protein [Larkinella soli]|uniref:DUF2141 domain-containing protein n=1 Tax=Larkinella soli TaxID=1770527 RepID=UPI000FFC5935|nr:DUF2141 domain-containing protein [Larkinella soli]
MLFMLNKLFIPALLLSVLSAPFSGPGRPYKARFIVEIQNIRHQSGQIRIGVYKPCKNFPLECRPFATQTIAGRGQSIRVPFEFEPGSYAVAVFHDVNDNGKMDKKLFGIPKEPYGFSNNFRPVLSGPSFEDCQVKLGDEGTTVSIRLL